MSQQSDNILEAKIEISSPSEKFYDFFRNHLGDLVNLFPELVHSIQPVEGKNFSAGSIILFTYQLGDHLISQKWSIKVVDDAKKSLIYEAIGGVMEKLYKVLDAKLEVINGELNKGEGTFAKWTVEFEKANENVPSPASHMELLLKIVKGVDAHLSKN